MRGVSKRFYASVNTYDRFEVKFQSSDIGPMKLIARTIQSSNIISLQLFDYDQKRSVIQLFMGHFNIKEFSRLRSLAFCESSMTEIEQILRDININSLIALTIDVYDRKDNVIPSSICQLISRINIQKLDIPYWNYTDNITPWSIESQLQYLSIQNCTFNEYHTILSSLNQLRTFEISKCDMTHADKSISLYAASSSNDAKRQCISIEYRQLISLTIHDGSMSAQDLEYLILLTPSLTCLKLLSFGNIRDQRFDGFYWEQFIQNNLRLLNKFQFYFVCSVFELDFVNELTSIIQPFQNSFWINNKHWLVTCDYIARISHISLYTTPTINNHRTEFLALQLSSTNPTFHFARRLEQEVNISSIVQFLFQQIWILFNSRSNIWM